jgi:hypothetical protein
MQGLRHIPGGGQAQRVERHIDEYERSTNAKRAHRNTCPYLLALSIQNIFDNKVEYTNSLPCKNCDPFQVLDKLKELSGASVQATAPVALRRKIGGLLADAAAQYANESAG